MAGDVVTVVVSGAVSLVSAFGSILLKDHLDQRREARKQASPGAPLPSPGVAAPAPAAPGPAPQPLAGRRKSWWLAAATIVFGLGMGLFEPGVHGNAGKAMLVGMLAAGVALLVHYIRPAARSAFGYQLGVLSLWGAFFAAASASRGYLRDDTIFVFATLWGGFALVGLVAFGLTYRWGRARRSPT